MLVCKEWPRAVSVWDSIKQETQSGSTFGAKWDGVQMHFSWIAIFGKDQWRFGLYFNLGGNESITAMGGRKKERAVEGALELSWHKFQSHIMWQVSWQDQCSSPGVSRSTIESLLFEDPYDTDFFLEWWCKCRGLFAMKWQRDASSCDTSDIRLTFGWNFTEKAIPARPPKAIQNTSYNSYSMRNGNALKWDLAVLSLEFIWAKLLTLLTQDNKNWLEPHK